MHQTKIIATIGPASESKEILKKMIEAGMNVARLNFSHGEHAWHAGIIKHIRELSEELGRPIGILADIQGPRIRTKTLENELAVAAGDTVWIADISHPLLDLAKLKQCFLLDQPDVLSDIQEGDGILIADGAIQLKALGHENGLLKAAVLNDGVIRNRKGVNLPDSVLKLPILTPKDEADLEFVVKHGVDYIGLSFVGSAEDIRMVRTRVALHNPQPAPHLLPRIVAKIERREALKNLDKIVQAADAVMVARGDLGIEMPESEVVLLQKQIIQTSLRAVKPVIVATQMLKSMVDNPRPTRAEVSDVTNAVIDHADAVMLSEESAAGSYPVEAVAMMREIVEKTEASPFDDVLQTLDMNLRSEHATVVRSVYQLMRSYDAAAVLIVSETGFTARLMSHFRPSARIFVATPHKEVYQSLSLVWGVEAVLIVNARGGHSMIEQLIKTAKESDSLKRGERAIVCLGRQQARGSIEIVDVRTIA